MMVVTGMYEPANDILQRDRFESSGDSVIQSFSGTCLHLSHPRFQLGESEFERVQVRAVAREKKQRAAFGFDSFSHVPVLVDVQPI